jgi:branched-chain amino acid transport system ATP-binding protein
MSGHLIATGLTKRYAGLVANDNVDIEVRPGEIVGLIGPNGAGKTTCFNCLTGAQKLTSGSITLDGTDISYMPASERADMGLARTFQQAQLFKHLSVEENLLLGRHRHYGASALRAALGLAGGAERKARDIVHSIAAQCGLTDVLDAPVGDLPFGTPRMVDSTESAYFGALLARISREREMSVLIIEHDVAMILSICDRIYVLNFGKLLAQGTPADIRANAEVRAAYFGSTVQEAAV